MSFFPKDLENILVEKNSNLLMKGKSSMPQRIISCGLELVAANFQKVINLFSQKGLLQDSAFPLTFSLLLGQFYGFGSYEYTNPLSGFQSLRAMGHLKGLGSKS